MARTGKTTAPRTGQISKHARHEAILEAIRGQRITNQEQLRELLEEAGFAVTQATVSRDIRELRLVKVAGAGGVAAYTLPEEWESTPPLQSLLPTLYASAEGTGNLLVVRTMTGGAQAVALAIDWEEWPEVLGTIAGDDTILIICREADQVPRVQSRIEEIAEG
jgi:transcriptional regulator of arginine metabolism